MFSVFYDLGLFLIALFALPKLLWQWWVLGKYRESLSARLGFTLPSFSPKPGQEVIWIHAVSMGETRAVIPLFRLIREAFPNAAVVLSTTTETGHAEAKRSMPEAEAHFFLTLDFSWIIKKLFNRIRPTTLILCESDFWHHLLSIAKKRKAQVALVNGKISERSCNRFRKFPFLSQRIFPHFDTLCVQNDTYRDRFLSMGIPSEKLFTTGNLKFDAPVKKMDDSQLKPFRDALRIAPTDRVLVIGSTHAKEEDWLLSVISCVWETIPNLKVLLVPRHPERFNEVFQLVKEKGFSCSRYTAMNDEKLILIDTMGLLNQCYQISDIAIVGGSFVTHVGGHNIFEPVLLNVPVFFGPHMQGQPELKDLILNAHAGRELSIEELPSALIEILENSQVHSQYVEACKRLAHSVQGSSKRTFSHIFNNLRKTVEV